MLPNRVCLIFIITVVYGSIFPTRLFFEVPVFQSKFPRSGAVNRTSLHTPNARLIPTLFGACVIANNIPKNSFIYLSLVNSLTYLFSFIFFHVIHFSNSPSGIDLNKVCEADIVFQSVALNLFMDGLYLALEYRVVLI